MLKRILLIIGGCVVLVLGWFIFLLYSTCNITYLTDRGFSADGTYYVHAQNTECPLLYRYTIDVIITNTKQGFFEKLNGSSSEDVLILKGSSPIVAISWIDNRTVRVRYSKCQAIYGKIHSWRDLKITHEGSCSIDN